MMDKKLSMTYFLSAGETNAEAEASLPLLTSRIIDISTAHANALGIGNPAMEHMGCGWVLSRLALEMFQYPRVNDTYRLTTWIESYNRHFSERIVQVSTIDDKPLGFSRAIWMVLDYNTRESVGLGHLNVEPDLIIPGQCPVATISKHVPVLPAEYSGVPPRGAVVANAKPFDYRYKYCDLDFYRHVNTVRYVELLLNRFDLAQFDETRIRRMELAFMRESHYGQEVTVLRHDDGLRSHIAICDKATGESSLMASLLREKRV